MLFSLFAGIPASFAGETDQFSRPPRELQDLGETLSLRVYRTLEKIVSRQGTFRPLSEEQLAKRVYDELGFGWPETHLESWLSRGEIRPRGAKQPLTFVPVFWNSVYTNVGSATPGSFIFTSPTVRLYGVHAGTDKVGHLFQQGHEYLEVYRKSLARGATEAEALRAAIDFGIELEKTIYGIAVDGVYSNGDLVANYAGLLFYLNLTRRVTIGERTLPPVLFRAGGTRWILNPKVAPAGLLKPYISDHLNESMNPSRYVTPDRETIRANVRSRCEDWLSFYAPDNRAAEKARHRTLRAWHGIDYGHDLPESEEISVASECL